jgi:hypothetical protein
MASTSPVLERRTKKRFSIERPIRYRSLFGPTIGQVANGRAIDASSSGIWIETEQPLRVGDPLELLVDWPAQLNGLVPLQLVTAGCVIRVSGNHAAVSIERYEFRTKSQRETATS